MDLAKGRSRCDDAKVPSILRHVSLFLQCSNQSFGTLCQRAVGGADPRRVSRAHSPRFGRDSVAPLLTWPVQGPVRGRFCDYNRAGLRQHHVNHSTSVCLHLKASQRTQCRWKSVNRVNENKGLSAKWLNLNNKAKSKGYDS